MRAWELYINYYNTRKYPGGLRSHIKSLREFRNDRMASLIEDFDDDELQNFLKDYPYNNLDNDDKNVMVSLYVSYPPTGDELNYNIEKNAKKQDREELVNSFKYKNMGAFFFVDLSDAEIFITSLKMRFSADYKIREM